MQPRRSSRRISVPSPHPRAKSGLCQGSGTVLPSDARCRGNPPPAMRVINEFVVDVLMANDDFRFSLRFATTLSSKPKWIIQIF